MAKSQGNTIAPSFIIRGGPDAKANPAYGVDVLRIFLFHSCVGFLFLLFLLVFFSSFLSFLIAVGMLVASSDYTKDISVGPSILRVSHYTNNTQQ